MAHPEDAAATAPARRRAADFLPLLPVLALFACSAGGFALHQTIWLDEATQLEGIALGPAALTRWLTGTPHDFGYWVAPDRTPPLSYYYQQAWAGLAGAGEPSFRWSGILCAGLALALTFAMARRAHGLRPALGAALMVGVAPALIEKAVEIRAYPLYLLLATAATYAAARHIQTAAGVRWLLVAAALAIATCYTHFQGIVFATALLLALVVHERLARRPVVWPIVCLLAVWGAAAGLAPFVRTSVSVSRHGAHFGALDRLVAIDDLVWSFIGHRINLDFLPLIVLPVIGALLLLAATIRSRPLQSPLNRLLLLATGFGLLAVVAASLVITAFKPGLYQYNIWIAPMVAVVAGSSLGASVPRVRRLAWTGAAILLACQAIGAARLVTGGQTVAHGADMRIIAKINEIGHRNVAVVHDAGSQGTDVQVYYPLAYFTRGRLRQYVFNENTKAFWRHEDRRPTVPSSLPTPYVIVVRAGPRDLARFTRDEVEPLAPGPAAAEMAASLHWRCIDTFTYAAYFKMTTWVYERVR